MPQLTVPRMNGFDHLISGRIDDTARSSILESHIYRKSDDNRCE